MANLIEQHHDELVDLEVLDNGKPKGEVVFADMQLVLQCFRYYAGWTDKITGQLFETSGPLSQGLLGSHHNILSYTKPEPVGVVGAGKLAPALACGCPVVLKTAEQTPLSAQRLGELIIEAGFPKGAVNIVPGLPETGKIIAAHNGIDKVAFTGSTEVGHSIVKASGAGNLKRVSLELGGKSPIIVCNDASLEEALATSQLGMFFNQGEVCNATSRVYVQENLYDQFVERTGELTQVNHVSKLFCVTCFV